LKVLFPDIQIDYIGGIFFIILRLKTPLNLMEIRLSGSKADSFEKATIVGKSKPSIPMDQQAVEVRKYVNEVISIVSTLIRKRKVRASVTLFQS
jgi:hypothetical protein